MANDYSYRLSFIFAVVLHLLLILFLFIKFTVAKPVAEQSDAISFINATAINVNGFNHQMHKVQVNKESLPKQETVPAPPANQQPAPVPQSQPQQPVDEVKKQVAAKERLQTLLQKNLLIEQAKEVAELKKERQKRKAVAIKQQQQQQQRKQQLQKMLQDQVVAEQKELTASRQAAEAVAHSAHSGEINKYGALIKEAINSQWLRVGGEAWDVCQVRIRVAPGGVVLNVQLISSSGNPALEHSAQTAVYKASPLPVPEDTKLFEDFRDIELTFKPEGIVESGSI